MENLGENMDKEEIEFLINEIDLDGDGQINYEEFYMMMNASNWIKINFNEIVIFEKAKSKQKKQILVKLVFETLVTLSAQSLFCSMQKNRLCLLGVERSSTL